ncbi:MAG: glycoside hydrolase family 15 protein [Alphaproteobacteria bacterium]|nr:glycoside hydrolase family 15 protein [Alphaproteobacteria bacterium]
MKKLDLIVIGNGHIAACIDKGGRHVWYCHPRLDADPVFNHLINGENPERGFMDVQLADLAHTSQHYVRNTAVAETILTDKNGNGLRIIDAAPYFRQFGRIFHPSTIIRKIEPVAGQCRIRVRIRPSFAYNAETPRQIVGSNHISYQGKDTALRVTTDMPVSFIEAESEFTLDKPIYFIIGEDSGISEHIASLATEFIERTTAHWQSWALRLGVPFDWQEECIRAAITLKLCHFEDSGAIVAALTTSIPESAHSGRNWDYRFCWLRDSYFTLHALNRLGAIGTMEDYIGYIVNIINGNPDLAPQPLYPIVPGAPTKEQIAENLAGFLGMGPVRVGNAAVIQRQNDVYGSVVLAAAQMFWDCRLKTQGGEFLYEVLARLGRRAYDEALTPDAGIWEYRGRAKVHTFSAAMCWTAVRQLGLIAAKLGKNAEAADWKSKAADIKLRIYQRLADNGKDWFPGSLDGNEIDASVLLLPEIGFIKASDPLFLKTLEMVEQNLLREGLVMRYVDADDFGAPDTAFLVCSFWYVDALIAAGQRDKAMEIFRRVLSYRNHAGLLSEDVDPKDGSLWGNFPQAYSQVGLILSALKLSQSWEQGLWQFDKAED